MKYTDEQVEAIIKERDQLAAALVEVATITDNMTAATMGEVDAMARVVDELVRGDAEDIVSRRDARMKAEALEEVLPMVGNVLDSIKVKMMATKYRKQAEGIS